MPSPSPYTGPTVTSVSPTSGAVGGGTSVTINGTNFYAGGGSSAVTGVSFANTSLTATATNPPTVAGTYYVSSNTVILAVSPAGSGTEVVTVTTSQGTSTNVSTVNVNQFVYAGPNVTSPQPGRRRHKRGHQRGHRRHRFYRSHPG